jgi:hypothetical protein
MLLGMLQCGDMRNFEVDILIGREYQNAERSAVNDSPVESESRFRLRGVVIISRLWESLIFRSGIISMGPQYHRIFKEIKFQEPIYSV